MVSRVAVVGLGAIAPLHLAAIEADPHIQLAAVCDTDPERAQETAARLGVPAYLDHREMLDRAELDVVHITTPHHQHVPVALDALAAGVHVLTEKPVAASIAQAEALQSVAQRSPLKVGVVLQNRYNPTSVAIREALGEGRIGDVLGARAAVWWSRDPTYYAAAPWRGIWSLAGGGVLINQTIHTLDLLLWLLGPAASVKGRAATLALEGVIEVEDTAAVLIQHRDGPRSTFFATNSYYRNAEVELEIGGTEGVLLLRDQGAWLVKGADRTLLASDPQASGETAYWGTSHADLISDFHARLHEPSPFWIGPSDGIAAQRVLQEVYRQSELGAERGVNPN